MYFKVIDGNKGGNWGGNSIFSVTKMWQNGYKYFVAITLRTCVEIVVVVTIVTVQLPFLLPSLILTFIYYI